MASKLISVLRPFNRNILKSVAAGVRCQSTSVEQSLNGLPATEVSAASNGLRVASQDSGGELCTVGLWIDAGSRFETPANNGVSNFVEHMIFKGTHNKTQLQLETEIEGMGARFGAQTGREQIAYYATCLKKDLNAVVNILADAVQNPLLDEETIEKERGVILKDLDEYGQNLENVAFDYVHTTAYQGTALSQSVFGTTANIKSLTKSDLQSYVSANFIAPRIALAGAGGVNHADLVKMAEENFSGLPSGSSSAASLTPCRFTGSCVSDRNDDLPYAHFILAVEGCGWTSDDYFPLMLAKTIVGSWNRRAAGAGNMFGLLPSRAVEYGTESYNAFNTCYTDTGLFGVHMVAGKMHIDDTINIMQRELVRLSTAITDNDVARAKAALKTNLLLQLDDPASVCANIGHNILAYDRHVSPAELVARIDAVGQSEVKNACMTYIYDKCPAVSAVGPVEGLTDYNRIRGNMYWVRV